MMNAKLLLVIFMLINLFYEVVTIYISNQYRKKPLPVEVSDIYEKERYQTYLAHTYESNRLHMLQKMLNLGFDLIYIFSPFYKMVEKLGNHQVYFIFLVHILIMFVVSTILDYIFGYIYTFQIQEKYGLNKQTKEKFNHDFLIETVPSGLITFLLYAFLIYVFEHLDGWTNHFTFGFKKMMLFLVIAGIILFIIYCILIGMSYFMLKKKYQFTPLEDGELKDKIMELQKGSKKQVKHIYVYDESKNSTSKNAFLLKVFAHREFGIADNFIKENELNELYAVLSHEIGHLKHKKTILNYASYLILILFFSLCIYVLYHVQTILTINQWIFQSFGLDTYNYLLLFQFYLTIINPIFFLFMVYRNNVTRLEEYEADREAVKNGYGNELIHTFKNVSRDELINVNPSPIIEFLEYDHPGMYQRIKAIIKAMNQK